jgi:hypothetical protein
VKNSAYVFYTVLFSIAFISFFSSCKKINEGTTLGGGLIPAVDNITTFDTTLEVEAYNDLFTLTNDSVRLTGSEIHYLGNITNDPLFGTSAGTIFAQFKPSAYKFSFPFASLDSLIGLDSVVLVLNYNSTFGDSTVPQTVNVYEMDQSNDFRQDSSYLIRENNFTYSNMLGSGSYTPMFLNDSVYLFKDSAINQLRIRLNDAFGQRLLTYDSATAYGSDSLFNTAFKGFAITPGGSGNALIGINLSNSKLSIYYRYKHSGILDTTVTDFTFTPTCASANYLQRDYSGSQLAAYAGQTNPADLVFLQNTPGSYATIKIPGLKDFAKTNRIIHLAELDIQQVYDPSDETFAAPEYLYLDAYDSAKSYFRSIPYDVSTPDATTGSLILANPKFGFLGKLQTDAGGHSVTAWRFDISRYVQHLVNATETPYTLRLYTPFFARNYFKVSGTDYYYAPYINSTIAEGRVRVYGGLPNTNPERMRLRIVYSKL